MSIGYPSGFVAIDPPAWLQQDMAVAQQKLPGIRVLVLFHDQLRSMARSFGFDEHFRSFWPDTRDITIQKMAHSHLDPNGCLRHDAPTRELRKACPISGGPEITTLPLARPRNALIILPKQSITAAEFSRMTTGLTCTANSIAIPQRGAFWHEFGHLQNLCEKDVSLRDRVDEKKADLAVPAGCAASQDITTAMHFSDWRTVSCFASEISASDSKYWNLLAIHKLADNETQDLASLLELKVRATGRHPHTDREKSFIRQVMIDPGYQPVREAFNGRTPTERLIERLADASYKPMTFPHSQGLANRLFVCAQRLSPGTFQF